MTSNDITKLGYEKINDKYSKAKYLDIECIMDITNGYINATKFCGSVSNEKTLNNYLKTNRCKNLVKYLEEPDLSGSSVSILIKDNTSSNELRGTYVHSDLLFDVASWISPEAYFKASRIVNNFLVREREEEIRKLTGDKSELVKMLEASDKRREEAEKRAEAMLLKMTLQNEKTHDKLDKTQDKLDKTHDKLDKTHVKLDKTYVKLDKTKVTLKRIETCVEKIVKEVVHPAK